ncbi:bacteriohemerythrin [Desulfopila aestuarii]|uniref:diguanylate cyclase n=1 Tax=Desulfopila aestuarii DSM 18488 TaxID=1121416 RepID=A0A1M7YL20_9BACT|nr:bacteriohemerythrin [Desulfopila aestuarii]SHO53309.1 diguanylate cyclase (GGDEF) domain-containing protein/hemerythrin-like metal-binding domain protein [Desulfopila aestuarii DSM 18488]
MILQTPDLTITRHAIGDEALKRMANTCKNGLRSIDVFGRIGGEEFGALLVKTDADLGRQVAERIRRSVEKIVLPTEQGLVRFSVSIGGIAFADNHQTLDYRLQQADEALYLSKSAGRNRVTLTNDSTLPEEAETLPTSYIRLEWSKAYECGNDVIDEQHRQLFQCANALLSAMISGQENDICLQLIQELIAGIAEHFSTEEQLIEAAGFQYHKEHKQIHRELTEKAEHIAQTHQAGKLNVAEVFQFLAVEVVSQHMFKEDRRYFACFQK